MVKWEIWLHKFSCFIVQRKSQIMKKKLFVCLKSLPVCLCSWTTYCSLQKMNVCYLKRPLIPDSFRSTIWWTLGYFITYSRDEMISKETPGANRSRNKSHPFNSLKAALVSSVILRAANFQWQAIRCSLLNWTLMLCEAKV